jgi:hypothetical protein
MRRLVFVLLVCFNRPPPQFWLLGLHASEFLVLLPRGLLQWSLALGLVVQVDFIVITVIEMDMLRLTVTRRGRLSLAKVVVPHMVLVPRLLVSLRVLAALNILIHRRYSCCFVVLLPLSSIEGSPSTSGIDLALDS